MTSQPPHQLLIPSNKLSLNTSPRQQKVNFTQKVHIPRLEFEQGQVVDRKKDNPLALAGDPFEEMEPIRIDYKVDESESMSERNGQGQLGYRDFNQMQMLVEN